jgi:hypothetical protein
MREGRTREPFKGAIHDSCARRQHGAHVRTCYKATHAVYTGRTAPVGYRIFPADAALLHPRLFSQVRCRRTNVGSLERALISHGTPRTR